MRHNQRKSVRLAPVLLAAALINVYPEHAFAIADFNSAGFWEMADPIGCTSLADSAPALGNNIGVVSNTSAVTCNGERANFAGWVSLINASGAVPAGSTVTADWSQVRVADGTNVTTYPAEKSALNPGLRSFVFKARFKPANVVRSVDMNGDGDAIDAGEVNNNFLPKFTGPTSLNIIQKGSYQGPNGQMKMELVGDELIGNINGGDVNSANPDLDEVNVQLLGRIRCTFQDEDFDTVPDVSINQVVVWAGTATNLGVDANGVERIDKVECGIDRTIGATGVAFVVVAENHTGVVNVRTEVPLPVGFGKIIPTPGGNTNSSLVVTQTGDGTSGGKRAFYIGQKPESTDPRDMFAGKVYYIRYFIDT
jgi:hypothetical protein